MNTIIIATWLAILACLVYRLMRAGRSGQRMHDDIYHHLERRQQLDNETYKTETKTETRIEVKP